MSEEEPAKKRFTCPNCGNNVSAPPEDVAEPVDCPHCGETGQFTLAKGEGKESEEGEKPAKGKAGKEKVEEAEPEPAEEAESSKEANKAQEKAGTKERRKK